jgi:hypothetical protein
VQEKGVVCLRGKEVGLPPAILSEHKVTHARLLGERARILEPMVEPAQQDRVRVKQRLGTKVRRPDTIAPGNVHPRPGNEVLVFARNIAPCGIAQLEETVDAAMEIGVVPTGEVQRRNTDSVQALADVQRCPIFAGRIVIQPVEHVGR